MNWEAIGTLAEIVGAAAVVASLIYLAIQVRYSNKQSELESYRHTWSSLNELEGVFSSSTEMASIINRGRKSIENLNEDEKLIFVHFHIRILNTIESWHHQVVETSKTGAHRDNQLKNIDVVIEGYFGYPGAAEVWKKTKHGFVPIQEAVDRALKKAQMELDKKLY